MQRTKRSESHTDLTHQGSLAYLNTVSGRAGSCIHRCRPSVDVLPVNKNRRDSSQLYRRLIKPLSRRSGANASGHASLIGTTRSCQSAVCVMGDMCGSRHYWLLHSVECLFIGTHQALARALGSENILRLPET